MNPRPEGGPEAAEQFVRRRLSLRHLRTLIALEQAASLSAAAELLHVTQPAVSKTLAQIWRRSLQLRVVVLTLGLSAVVILVLGYRGTRILGGAPINNWPRGKVDTGDASFAKRVSDAHANCLENLPIFAVIVLAGAAMGRLDDLQALAPWVLVARIGQSLAHLSGTGPAQVFVRATFWAAQLALFVWMFARLLA